MLVSGDLRWGHISYPWDLHVIFGGVARLRLDELAASLNQISEMDSVFAPLEAELSKSQKLEIITLRKHSFLL